MTNVVQPMDFDALYGAGEPALATWAVAATRVG